MAAKGFNIEGLDGVLRRMRQLPVKLQKKGLRAALRKGARIVRDDAKRRARRFDDPKTPNKVWKEVAVRADAKASRAVGGMVMKVGVRGGARRYTNNKQNRKLGRVGGAYEGPGNVYYWRFLEFGTEKMAAQPFMRPALASNIQPVTEAIVRELKVQLDKAVR